MHPDDFIRCVLFPAEEQTAPITTDCTYEVFYNGKRDTIKAVSLYAAKLQAIVLFKPRRSQEHMVSVVLVARADGSTVTVPTDF